MPSSHRKNPLTVAPSLPANDQTSPPDTARHFFETDLPLPLARKLHVEKLIPPHRVRLVRGEMASRIDDLGTCRLTQQERATLEVPLVDTWYRHGRSTRLHHFERLVNEPEAHQEAKKITAITEQMFKDAGTANHSVWSIEYMAKLTQRYRTDGMMLVDLLLSRGVRRIEEIVRARLAELTGKARTELKRRFEAIIKLRETPLPEPEPALAAPSLAVAAPRDLLEVGRQVDGEKMRKGVHDLITLVCSLEVPSLSLDGWERDERKSEKEEFLAQIRAGTDPHAPLLARECLSRLYPAEPWLADSSGVRPESLAMLLSWRTEYDRFGELAAQLAQDAEDTDRVVWLYGRHLIRTVMNDFLAGIVGSADQVQRHQLLFRIGFAVQQMHKSPPPNLVRQWIDEKREAIEAQWRTRLGAEPAPVAQGD